MRISQEDLAALASTRTIDLTTIGRRSGNPRTIEIWWFYVDGRFIITGTPGKRDWLANVRADPRVTVSAPLGSFGGVVREVTDEAWRRSFFVESQTSWYRSQADLDDLVSSAPMVEVLFEADA